MEIRGSVDQHNKVVGGTEEADEMGDVDLLVRLMKTSEHCGWRWDCEG